MNFGGFIWPYKAGRPLKEDERLRQLHQKQRLDVDEGDDLTVIKFNANYMEVVDKWFAWRGVMLIAAAMCLGFSLFFMGMPFYVTFVENIVHEGWWLMALLLAVMMAPLVFLGVWLIRLDAFRFTHFPIRLNREKRMVHVFRTNGTILSVAWDEIFFCIAALPQNAWEIQGHVLDKDSGMVKETFVLPVTGAGENDRDQLPRYWEFVRRYMEDGPAAVAHRVEYCLPIADRKESFTDGFHHLHGQVHGLPALVLIPLMLLIYVLPYPGRWIAMRTSKLPVWPKEIEDVCVIQPSDPYRRDASTNKPITDHTLVYVVLAFGVALAAGAWWYL